MEAKIYRAGDIIERGKEASKLENQLPKEFLQHPEINSVINDTKAKAKRAQKLQSFAGGHEVKFADFNQPSSVLGFVYNRGHSPVFASTVLLSEQVSEQTARHVITHEKNHLELPRNVEINSQLTEALEFFYSKFGLPKDAYAKSMDTALVEGYTEWKTQKEMGTVNRNILYAQRKREVPFVKELESWGAAYFGEEFSFKALFHAGQMEEYRKKLLELYVQMSEEKMVA